MSITPQRWMSRAACRTADAADAALFFGADFERPQEREARETAAKAVCAVCPVRWHCGSYATAAGEKSGIWGGMTEDERAAERRRYLRRIRGRAA